MILTNDITFNDGTSDVQLVEQDYEMTMTLNVKAQPDSSNGSIIGLAINRPTSSSSRCWQRVALSISNANSSRFNGMNYLTLYYFE